MRRTMTWLLSTISALVLLFSYHTSTNAAGASTVIAQGGEGTASNGSGSTDTGSGDTGSTSSGGTDSGSSSGSSSSEPSQPPSVAPAAAKTYTGDAVSTRYGDVQVRITVRSGKVVKAAVTKVPWSEDKDKEINGYAVPILNQEAVSSQSASIDMVSGASYTSQGYVASLQSALDQANL